MHIKRVNFWCQLQTQRGLKITLLQGKTRCRNPIRWSVGPTTAPAWMPISQMDEHGESLLWEECVDLFLCLRSYLKQPPFLANPARQRDCRDFKPEFEQFHFEKIPFHLFSDSWSLTRPTHVCHSEDAAILTRLKLGPKQVAGWKLTTARLIPLWQFDQSCTGERKKQL